MLKIFKRFTKQRDGAGGNPDAPEFEPKDVPMDEALKAKLERLRNEAAASSIVDNYSEDDPEPDPGFERCGC